MSEHDHDWVQVLEYFEQFYDQQQPGKTLDHIRNLLWLRPPLDKIQKIVVEYQVLYYAPARPETSEALEDLRELKLGHLWECMCDDLIQIARKWIYSNLGRDIRATSTSDSEALRRLAEIGFVQIYLSLPMLQLDIDKNLAAYLHRTAKNGLISQNKACGTDVLMQREVAKDVPFVSGASQAAMWYSTSDDMNSADIDRASIGWEERLLDSLYDQTLLRQIWEYIVQLPSPDRDIIVYKYQDPPMPTKSIAELLGMTEGAVRQRLSRAIKKIRTHRQEIVDREQPTEA